MQIDFERFLKDLYKTRQAAMPKPKEDERPFHIRRAAAEMKVKEERLAAEAAHDPENSDYGVDRGYDDE